LDRQLPGPPASEVGQRVAGGELGVAYDDMRAYMSLADGREFVVDRGLPLAD